MRDNGGPAVVVIFKACSGNDVHVTGTVLHKQGSQVGETPPKSEHSAGARQGGEERRAGIDEEGRQG